MQAIELGELLAKAASESQQRESQRPFPLEEAQIMELRRLNKEFQKGCPYKVGDLVTPRKCAGLRNAGKPHIVVEVFDEPVRMTAECGSPHHLSKMEMRTMAFSDADNICVWAGEAWLYEPYVG